MADDKVVYAWVPDIIRYYLGEEPLIPNVPTYRCLYDEERRFVIDNIGELVVKPANESGGYGLLIGNQATREDLDRAGEAIEADPRNWVAQPILNLSTAPDVVRGRASNRATSTCGPSSSPAPPATSPRAASRASRCARARWS